MSKDIVVLAPNGRRQTVKCNLNTTILQILEEVCKKQGFDPDSYDLTHHNKVLDLSNTVRFSNLPNKASLEMAETKRKREENDVTIALQLENEERRTGQFKPQTSLYEVLESLAAAELPSVRNPTVVYTRREVHGRPELEGTTLRQLGLTGGRAVLRLLDMSPEELKTQANVSSVLPPKPIKPEETKPIQNAPETSESIEPINQSINQHSSTPVNQHEDSTPGPSNFSKPYKDYDKLKNPIKLIRDEMKRSANINAVDERDENMDEREEKIDESERMEVDESGPSRVSETLVSNGNDDQMNEELLQRRLNIEQEVNFLGDNKAIAYEQSSSEPRLADLPDDFYELTVDEVRRLYVELRNSVTAIAERPLLTSQQREARENSERRNSHKHALVRVQFPDRTVLQGVFQPTDTLRAVYDFTRQYLLQPDRPFHLFTTPSRETVDPSVTLEEAGFVPGVLVHFRWADSAAPGAPASGDARCLKQSVYDNLTPCDAAAMLAYKYRATARQKREVPQQQTSRAPSGPSSSKDGKVPKWLKLKP